MTDYFKKYNFSFYWFIFCSIIFTVFGTVTKLIATSYNIPTPIFAILSIVSGMVFMSLALGLLVTGLLKLGFEND